MGLTRARSGLGAIWGSRPPYRKGCNQRVIGWLSGLLSRFRDSLDNPQPVTIGNIQARIGQLDDTRGRVILAQWRHPDSRRRG